MQKLCTSRNLDWNKILISDRDKLLSSDVTFANLEGTTIWLKQGNLQFVVRPESNFFMTLKTAHSFLENSSIPGLALEEPQIDLPNPVLTIVKYPIAEEFSEKDQVCAFLGIKDDTCHAVLVLKKMPEPDNHMSIHKVLMLECFVGPLANAGIGA